MLSQTKAQQLPQYTQYMLNEFAINPAVAGKEDFDATFDQLKNKINDIITDMKLK